MILSNVFISLDMSFSSVPATGAKKGSNWTYKIYFSPEADKSSSSRHEIEDEELIDKLQTLLDVNENVENIWAYKHALFSWQISETLLYHMLILFETKDWWWSIEKNSEGITIQRSKYKDDVLNKYRGASRPALTEMKTDTGKRSMKELIEWLYQKDELNKRYNVLNSNCQHFAKAIFDYVATSKNL
jgi:hypothetical protein